MLIVVLIGAVQGGLLAGLVVRRFAMSGGMQALVFVACLVLGVLLGVLEAGMFMEVSRRWGGSPRTLP